MILVLGVGLFLVVRNTLVVTQNPNFVPSLILIGAAVVPAHSLPSSGGSGSRSACRER